MLNESQALPPPKKHRTKTKTQTRVLPNICASTSFIPSTRAQRTSCASQRLALAKWWVHPHFSTLYDDDVRVRELANIKRNPGLSPALWEVVRLASGTVCVLVCVCVCVCASLFTTRRENLTVSFTSSCASRAQTTALNYALHTRLIKACAFSTHGNNKQSRHGAQCPTAYRMSAWSPPAQMATFFLLL